MPMPKSEAEAKANIDHCEAELRRVIPAHMLDGSSDELSGEYFLALLRLAGRMVGQRFAKDRGNYAEYMIQGGLAMLALTAHEEIAKIRKGEPADAA